MENNIGCQMQTKRGKGKNWGNLLFFKLDYARIYIITKLQI